MKRRIRYLMALFLSVVLVIAMAAPAFAATQKCTVKVNSAKVYATYSTSSKVIANRNKGDTVNVSAVKGNWVQVKQNGNTGYMLKNTLQSASVSSKTTKKTTEKTVKKQTNSKSKTVQKKTNSVSYSTKEIQTKLCKRGYLAKRYVTGKSSTAYKTAIRQFQILNGLSVTGKANAKTARKIMSSSSKMPTVSKTSWSKSGMSSRFPVGSIATIVDLSTGIRLKIRRVGGYNHADVEPATKEDTAKLKKIYGGTFSWDSKGVVLIVDGKYYAAAINGMPHGKQISTTNGYDGQFCLHLVGSKTHGTNSVNQYHQKSIKAVYNYFN